jgi:hypothetical protein
MFANLLAAPFVFLALAFLYIAWDVDSDYAVWIAPFVLISALIYTFSPQINWWWYSQRPPALRPGILALLERHCGFYRRLDEVGQKRFRDRVALFVMGTDWQPMGWPEETLPPDVQAVLAAQAVSLTFHRERFLFDKFEKVIVFPRPFSTPAYPYDHASELFEGDGCLLFSAEQVMQAFLQPTQWYNVGLHEYAHALVRSHPKADWPQWADEGPVWQQLEALSQMSRGHMESVVGLQEPLPLLPVVLHHFISFPEAFRAEMPEVAERILMMNDK